MKISSEVVESKQELAETTEQSEQVLIAEQKVEKEEGDGNDDLPPELE